MTATEETARLTARVAARTAHELNNVAAVFAGHVYLLREEAEPPEEGYAAMEKSLEHLQRLTASLSALGTLGSDEPETFDPAEVVREAASRAVPAGPGIEIEIEAPLPAILGRRRDLLRAVEALIANAREAAGESPVLVTARAADSTVEIRIEDRGSGVPAEIRRRNFDPLFTARPEKGRGIGVTVARLASAMAGGSLLLADRPGGGTCALLRIPKNET